jgi:hypothetical protein
MLYDLAAYQEHVEPLHEELQAVLSEDGGQFRKSTMSKLRKLDSFMKESQRVNPPGLSEYISFSQLYLCCCSFIPPADELFYQLR